MKLVFVYNANSGWVNTLIDIGHKAISPQTYECSLCDLTFGLLTEHQQWKQFRETSSTEMEFLHKDEFEQKYKKYSGQFKYPVILQEDNNLRVVISHAELNKIKTLEELIEQVKITTEMSGSE
ncbi:MAG: GTPase [Cyanobacteria bacterium J06621_12]